ncbi:MFS transporter [Acerihabitans arboris]|uniref:MFS transporter n=1 Tax=Acerihabitans arboris TaxID=2691583 RepID=A0A845SEF7_9GAMM|nr:MFS transporter [Acerihabitans arboris]NDL61792.1 MFS transporter [Acerihabitans arboris]
MSKSNIPAPARHSKSGLRPHLAAAVHTATLMTFFAASSAPTPLYRLYQASWSFSPMLLTTIFSAYALALLTSLLSAGALSDYIGRRPVISLALLLELLAMGVFLGATGPVWLIAARALQGLATGLAAAAIGAALLDLHHERGALANSITPMVGMALGALGASALLRFAPAPLHLVYVLLLLAFLLATGLTWCTPETAAGRPGAWASLRPSVVVPPQARAALLAVTPVNVAIWMLGGFYLSLMPSLIAKVTHSSSVWLGGLAVAALTLSGAAAIMVARGRPPFTALLAGAVMLALGMLAILLGVDSGLAPVLLAGSVIAGVGFGAGFLGALRTVMALAAPAERAGLMAAFYIECYLANSLPAIAAGYLVRRAGLLATAASYGVVIIALALLAIALALANRRRDRLRALTSCAPRGQTAR